MGAGRWAGGRKVVEDGGWMGLGGIFVDVFYQLHHILVYNTMVFFYLNKTLGMCLNRQDKGQLALSSYIFEQHFGLSKVYHSTI